MQSPLHILHHLILLLHALILKFKFLCLQLAQPLPHLLGLLPVTSVRQEGQSLFEQSSDNK